MDDRKSKELTDKRERERRAARAAARARGELTIPQPAAPAPRVMPGSGQLLTGETPLEQDDMDEEMDSEATPPRSPSPDMPGSGNVLGDDIHGQHGDIPPPCHDDAQN